jgi:hypothetical protein
MPPENFESAGRKKLSLTAFAAGRKVIPFHSKRAAKSYFMGEGFKSVPGNINAWRSDEWSAIWVSAPADEPAGFAIMRKVVL